VITNLLPGDPKEVGPYRLLGRLGQGGMGVVYLARSPGGRQVAVKVIRPEYANEPGFRARFTREVASARGVSGMFTALVVDADTNCPTPWFATAYVPGESLYEAVETAGPLPAATVLQLAAGLAEGLQAIHAAGVIHRDLKPSNVLLAADGPRVIDFGISKAREASMLTQTGMVMGSPGYLSPEQAEGVEVGPASDIFSLGGVLTYALTGLGPFGTGPTPALMFRVVSRDPDLTRVPELIRPLIERCLIKDPAGRPTPGELLTELDALGAGVGVVTPEWLPDSVTSQIARYVPTAQTPATPSQPAATSSDANAASGATSDASGATGSSSDSAAPVTDTPARPAAAAAELAGAGLAGGELAGAGLAGAGIAGAGIAGADGLAGAEEAEAPDAEAASGGSAESAGIPLTPAGVEAASAVDAPGLAEAGVASAAIAGAGATGAGLAEADLAPADLAKADLPGPALAGRDVAAVAGGGAQETRAEAAGAAAGLAGAAAGLAGAAAGAAAAADASAAPPAVAPVADLAGTPGAGDQHDLTFVPAALAADVGGLATIGLAPVGPSGDAPVVEGPAVGGPVVGVPVGVGPVGGGPVVGGPAQGGAAGGAATGGPGPVAGGPGGPVNPSPRRRLILAAAAAIVILAGIGVGAGIGLSGGGTGKASGGPTPTIDVSTSASVSHSATHRATATASKPAATKKPTKKPSAKPAGHKSRATPTSPAANTAPTAPATSASTVVTPPPTTPPPAHTQPPPTHTTAPPPPATQAWGGASGAANYGCTGPESSSPGSPTSYSFVNDSNAAISIAYYSTSGSYVGAGSVAAHSSAGVSTHTGYFWLVSGASGNCLGEIQVDGAGTATVVS